MTDLLSSLTSPEQLHEMNNDQLKTLTDEIRQRIIETVAANGGHLASNLGMVELTLALMKEFDFRRDKIVFDVGHQCYAWKLLTGRADSFSTLRTKGGISGFPKRSESQYDFFNTGHSSTSISAALGLVRAMDRTGRGGHAIAVIGDGALTGGMSFEALNDAGQSKENLIVILNDNQMSISPNVGGMSKHLEKLRISRGYMSLKNSMEAVLSKIPLIGKPICKLLQTAKSMDRLWLRDKGILFEQLGFRYYGPVDGHDIDSLRHHMSAIKNMNGPVLLHVLTQKGKGYTYAEQQPDRFHGIAPFVIESGVCKPGQSHCNQTFSGAFGQHMVELGKKDPRICAISAAMTAGTGLTSFAEKFPARFFDVGIAEQHALTMSAGLAAGGMKPIAALYSTFLQRAYDQLLHDICLQKLPVVLAIDRAGLVGEDGETHQGIYDLSLLLPLPELDVYCPIDEVSLFWSIDQAIACGRPAAIRYPRSSMPDQIISGRDKLTIDSCFWKMADGNDCTVAALGVMAENAQEACVKIRQDNNINCDLFGIFKASPFDTKSLIDSVKRTGRLVVIEDALVKGGFGESILVEIITAVPGASIMLKGIVDPGLDQASRFELLAAHRLDAAGIYEDLLAIIKE
ncbi:MAG: 1-deoxy-D-xylulose-5-phosphate synthase [Clostridiaceae bacterium]|nr:1-deoxy-D-xylulose-5-phosphate synthase [Clostridiaceae bacterium]